MVAIGLGGYFLVRRALQPVEQITRNAERITQHNLSERLPVAHTGDELERLSLSLNRMIARLDDAFQNSKRFVADASHELRTPLTVLRGELENLAEDPQLDAESRDRAGQPARRSRAPEQDRRATVCPFAARRRRSANGMVAFDLAELARTTAEQMSLLAEDKGIAIACDANQPVLVEGDRARLKQVVVNLLDNAIKYTPEKGAIQLRVGTANGHAVLEVADNGHRHSAGGAAARLRALLPRGPGALERPEAPDWDFPSSNPSARARSAKWKRRATRQRQPFPRQTAAVPKN